MRNPISNNVSSTTAVLLGALASGVNVCGPTWSLLKTAFLTLGVCLASMLALAFSSSDVIMMIHILIFVLISGTLFLLISSFLAQIGLVSVEQQMEEMGLGPSKEEKNSEELDKKS
ncbi:hypothetical protein MRB53_028292 [Persea americana]|uniref:Uncharacterized protein n=1 Tax=Persea americana TaxID=3435 RepID=A0ACC2KFA0_PERAE|nr:hypothetical protein MRB53_028292 [Persea americana]